MWHRDHAAIIIIACGEYLHLSLEIGLVHHGACLPYTSEVESLAIRGPAELIDAALEGFGDVGFAARLQIEHTEARAVALIAIALH